MQIDRVLDILLFLLKYKKTTAALLSERLGVNIRTVYRDIDTLATSGLPVCSIPGRHGGIYLDDERLDEHVIPADNEKELLALALDLLKSTNLFPADKLISKFHHTDDSDDVSWMSLDLDGSGEISGGSRTILLIREAILEHRVLQFSCCTEQGSMIRRSTCPVKVIYRQGRIYLLGFCRGTQKYQMVPLHQMSYFNLTDERFILDAPVSIPETPVVTVRLRYSSEESDKINDYFYGYPFFQNEDGSREVELTLYNDDSLSSYLLALGHAAEIVSPIWLKDVMTERLQMIIKHNNLSI